MASKAALRTSAHTDASVDGFGMIVEAPGEGRFVVAARDIPAGALVHIASPYTVTIAPRCQLTRCVGCLCKVTAVPGTQGVPSHKRSKQGKQHKGHGANASSSPPGACADGPILCSQCERAVFCGSACCSSYEPEHFASGECAVLRAVRENVYCRTEQETESLTIWLQIAARAMHEGHALSFDPWAGVDPDPAEVSDPSTMFNTENNIDAAPRGGTTADSPHVHEKMTSRPSGVEVLDPEVATDVARLQAHTPSWRQMAALVCNVSLLSKKECALSSSMYRVVSGFIGYYPRLSAQKISEHMFRRIYGAVKCNAFGVYEPSGLCYATCMYPSASYFNHSCAPNLCRVMQGRRVHFYTIHPVAQGDPLCITYTDPDVNKSERREVLLNSWRFECACTRCSKDAPLRAKYCNRCRGAGIGIIRPLDSTMTMGECVICKAIWPM